MTEPMQRFEEVLRAMDTKESQKTLGGLKSKRSNGGGHSGPKGTSWVKKSHWKRNSAILGFLLIIIVVGVYSVSQSAAGSSAHPLTVVNSDWKNAPLIDANSGKNFNLSQFAGKTIVLQFMAVYCQFCLAEAHQLSGVRQTFSTNGQADHVVVVSVDVDPNENLGQLQSYVSQNHFGAPNSNPPWYFAKDTSGRLLQSVIGGVGDFPSFIAQANMFFIDKSQGQTFYSMQRSSFQDASPASDIVAAAQKLF